MTLLLSLFYFFYFAVVGVYVLFLPKVLVTFGYSFEQIGIIFGAAPLVRFILPFFFIKGFVLNLKTFKLALFIMFLGALLFYYSLHSFYALLLSNILLGIGLGLVLPFMEVSALELLGKERYGKVRLFGSLGFVLVALVLVRYLEPMSRAVDFLLVLNALSVGVAFIIARELGKNENTTVVVKNDINLLADYKLWIALTLMQVSFGSFYNFFTIYETAHGISMQDTIYLWSFGVVVEIFMLFFQGRFLQKNLLKILQITMLATLLRWLLVYAFAENIALLYFAQSLHALSFALFHSAAISYLFHLYKNRALAQQFFSGITYGLGGFVGALLAGFIYQRYPEYLFLSSAGFIAIALLFLGAWRKDVTVA